MPEQARTHKAFRLYHYATLISDILKKQTVKIRWEKIEQGQFAETSSHFIHAWRIFFICLFRPTSLFPQLPPPFGALWGWSLFINTLTLCAKMSLYVPRLTPLHCWLSDWCSFSKSQHYLEDHGARSFLPPPAKSTSSWCFLQMAQRCDLTVFTLHPTASSLLLSGKHHRTTQCPCMPQSRRSEELTLCRVHNGIPRWC